MRKTLPIVLAIVIVIGPVSISCGGADDAESVNAPSAIYQTTESGMADANYHSIVKYGAMETEASTAGQMDLGIQTFVTDRMIVQTGNMTLKVSDIATTLENIKEITANLEGYVVASNLSGGEKQVSATISIRVPAHQFESAAMSLRDLAIEVLFENTESDDVTEEYTDLEAQLRNLEATENRYLELLERAETIEEMLKVEGMISQTRGKIEQTVGRMQYLERTSATSLITISLVEEAPLEDAQPEEHAEDIIDISSFAVQLEDGPRKGETVEFEVTFQLGNKVSTVISTQQTDLVKAFKTGLRLSEIQCFSSLAAFSGKGIVSEFKRITSGPRRGDYSLDITIDSL